MRPIVERAILICLLAFQLASKACEAGLQQPLPDSVDPTSRQARLRSLHNEDKCGTFYNSALHGYSVLKYRVVTHDHYELELHRLVHPEDQATGGPSPGRKKPYLLLHGLVGSSASFVRNVAKDYLAPSSVFSLEGAIDEALRHKADEYQHWWQSTADYFAAAFKGDTSADPNRVANVLKGSRPFSRINEIDFDEDKDPFGRSFKQAYRKFALPPESRTHISHSLAFTLSNFGYDVWLANLRGNHYSADYFGPLSRTSPEYWNFNMDSLVREDMLASISQVRRASQWTGSVGLVSYSYSSLYLLGLLASFPEYQASLQPIVMLAPSALTAQRNKAGFRYFVRGASKLSAQNGPFPSLGRSKSDLVEWAVCHLPVASKLCRLMELVLSGSKLRPGSLLLPGSSEQERLVRQDFSCGQTSKAVLRQLVANLSRQMLLPKYKPLDGGRRPSLAASRSVMLIHSDADEISTREDVLKIRDSALRSLALADVSIEAPEFGHTDFLFSKRNQYLVNGELVRMVALFDSMSAANKRDGSLRDS